MENSQLTRLGWAFDEDEIALIRRIMKHLEKSVGKVSQVNAIRYALRAASEKIDRECERDEQAAA